MKIKHFISVFCLAAGVILAVPATVTAADTTTLQTASNGWDETNTSYTTSDGKLATGITVIGERYYYFDTAGKLVTGQQGPRFIGKALYYINTDGTLARNTWMSLDDKSYYASDSCKLFTSSAQMIDGKTYCFNSKGVKLFDGMYTIKRKTYLLDSRGIAQTGHQRYQGSRYFFDSHGVKMTGLVKYGKHLYYTGSNGVLKTGWFKGTDGNTYYSNSRGHLKTGWQKYNGQQYYFNAKTGKLQGGWLKKNGNYYYYTTSGALKIGWFKIGGNTYYGQKSGSLKGARLAGLQKIGSYKYIFNTKGVLLRGWISRGGYKYYASSKGVISTGWRKIDTKWYFFENSGTMKTGWVVNNGNFYYLDSTGAMVTGRKTIDGKTYTFGKNGIYSEGQLPGSWSVRVNRAANVVTVYKGSIPVKAFLCSTGMNNATPLGTFRIMDKLYTHELNGPTFGYYCSHITSDILFHSIPAPTTSRSGVPSYKFNMLGNQASQGCIRLAMGDAYWLYVTCPIGTPVTVYDNANYPGPLGKPKAIKMATDPTYSWDPTDPNFAKTNTPH